MPSRRNSLMRQRPCELVTGSPLNASYEDLDYTLRATGRIFPSRLRDSLFGGWGGWLRLRGCHAYYGELDGLRLLFDRYMKRIKYTCYENTEAHHQFIVHIFDELVKRSGHKWSSWRKVHEENGFVIGPSKDDYNYTGFFRDRNVKSAANFPVWINGEVQWIYGAQYNVWLAQEEEHRRLERLEEVQRYKAERRAEREKDPAYIEKRLRKEWMRRKFQQEQERAA